MRETLVNFTIKSGTEIPPSPILHPQQPLSNHPPPPPPPTQAISSRNIWNKDIGNPLNTKTSEKSQNPRPRSLIEDEPIYI